MVNLNVLLLFIAFLFWFYFIGTESFMFRTPNTLNFVKDVDILSSALIEELDLSSNEISSYDWSELNHCIISEENRFYKTNNNMPVKQVIRYKHEFLYATAEGKLFIFKLWSNNKFNLIPGFNFGKSWFLYSPNSNDMFLIPIGSSNPYKYTTMRFNPIGPYFKENVTDRTFYFNEIYDAHCFQSMCFVLSNVHIDSTDKNMIYRYDLIRQSWSIAKELDYNFDAMKYSFTKGNFILAKVRNETDQYIETAFYDPVTSDLETGQSVSIPVSNLDKLIESLKLTMFMNNQYMYYFDYDSTIVNNKTIDGKIRRIALKTMSEAEETLSEGEMVETPNKIYFMHFMLPITNAMVLTHVNFDDRQIESGTQDKGFYTLCLNM